MMAITTEYFVERRFDFEEEGHWTRIGVVHPSFGKALDHIVRLREHFGPGRQYQVKMIRHEEGILWSTEDEVLESS